MQWWSKIRIRQFSIQKSFCKIGRSRCTVARHPAVFRSLDPLIATEGRTRALRRTHVRIWSNSMEQRWQWRCWNVTAALFAVRNVTTLCWSSRLTRWIQSTVSPRCFLKIPFNIIPASTARSSSFPTEHQTVNLCSMSVCSVKADSHCTSRFRSVTIPSPFRQIGPCSHCPSCSVTFRHSTW